MSCLCVFLLFFFSSRRRHTRLTCDWSSDVCSSDLAWDANNDFVLYRYDPKTTFVNFGFWDVVRSAEEHPAGWYNRKIERKVRELGGIKSLYSDSYYPEDEFWKIYNRPAYEALKAKYDPDGRFKDLYQKCVLRR